MSQTPDRKVGIADIFRTVGHSIGDIVRTSTSSERAKAAVTYADGGTFLL